MIGSICGVIVTIRLSAFAQSPFQIKLIVAALSAMSVVRVPSSIWNTSTTASYVTMICVKGALFKKVRFSAAASKLSCTNASFNSCSHREGIDVIVATSRVRIMI